tara:strand:+ start:1214 stop:2305 length:1092 start_codon:yes stop_codon:yes gene_type:complete
MKRKNLIAKKLVKSKNLLIKNIKILNFYKKFKSTIFKIVKNESFAVAISGGSDSLCLAYLGKVYSAEFNSKMHAVIVDHNLRKNSKKESLKVSKILKNKGIKNKILRWKGEVPKSNIQKNARIIRYSLIANYCKNNKIKYLLTGHHLDDQIENFFIRLFRGSGLTGLSSMSSVTNYANNLKVVRPLLSLRKSDLKYITKNYFRTYIEDPSNKNEKFLRVRVRKYRKNMEMEGLNTDKILKTINNLLSANNAINFYKNKALYKHVSFLSENNCLISKQIFSEEAGEVVYKCFSDTLSLVSGTYYPPRSKKISYLIQRIKKAQYTKSTLGGCIIEKRGGDIIISKEAKFRKIGTIKRRNNDFLKI